MTNLENCAPLLQLLQDLKNEPNIANFLAPVDWRTLKLDNYPQVVKCPMDLGTVEVSNTLDCNLVFRKNYLQISTRQLMIFVLIWS